ncbi:hypothetical protein D3C87_1774990 [compost metagenome]
MRRKKSRTKTARAEPITRSLAMWWMAREMKREESLVTYRLAPRRSWLMASISRLRASATWTVLEPDCLLMAMLRLGTPSM